MENHCSCALNRVLHVLEISQQSATSTWPRLNMFNSFLQHYKLAQAPQLQLGLSRLPSPSVGAR